MSVYLIFVVMQPPEERPDDLVSAKYVARRFACSTGSVYAGLCGTGGIVPVSRDPWRAVRSQVDEELTKFIERETGRKAAPARKLRGLIRRRPAGNNRK